MDVQRLRIIGTVSSDRPAAFYRLRPTAQVSGFPSQVLVGTVILVYLILGIAQPNPYWTQSNPYWTQPNPY